MTRIFLIALLLVSFCFSSPAEAFEYFKVGNSHVLIADPKKDKIDVVTGSSFGMAKPSTLARGYKAKAGINGTFFAPKFSMPIGLIISNGSIISPSFDSRSVFGIRRDNTPFIGNARVFAIASFRGFLVRFYIINQFRNNQNIFFTYHYGKQTGTKPNKLRREYTVDKNNKVVSILNGDQKIPPEGYVLSIYGNSNLSNLKVGDQLKVFTHLTGEWENTRLAVGGGPLLVDHGKVRVASSEEHFKRYITSSYTSRTAIGYTKTGKIIMLVTNKATLYEVAQNMVKLGAVQAINLDGGGSSVFYYKGKIINKTYDGRYIHNMIIVR